MARIGSLDDDLVGHLVTQRSQDMTISSLFLDETLNGFFQKFGLKSQELTDLIFQSPIFEQNKRGIIAAGLEAYFNNDHIIATHLLVPQIEDSIRNLVELTGGSVLKPNRSGGIQLRTFDDILRDECIIEVFDEDFSFYLRIFFTDQRGWNIRNSVCHGMCPTDTFQKHITDRLIHAFICLAQVQEKKQETA